MSTDPGNDKDLLAQELRRRSRVMPEHPISVDAVRAEARGIRRRRRIAAGAVAAVVLAIAAPVAVSSSGLLDGAPPAPVAPTPSPEPTGEASPEPSPGPAPTPGPDGRFTLTLEGLDRGPLSAEPVLIGRRLVTPEETVQVPAEVSQILPAGDGWLAIASRAPEGVQTVRLDADLATVESFGPGTRLAGDAVGTRVAYVRADGGVELVDEPVDGSAPAAYPLPAADTGPAPVGYAGDAGIVVEDTAGDFPGRASLVAPDGTVRDLDVLRVWATSSTGLVGAQTSYDDSTGRACSAALDATDGDRAVWETCDHTLEAFSPDGRYVAGGASDADALGSPTVAVLDARTGEVVVELTTRGRTMGVADQLAWEDEDTLLVSWTEDGRQGIVRVELDGSTELASEVVRTPPMAVSMWFAEISRG